MGGGTRHPPQILYGRRSGPRLRPGRKRLLAERLPKLEIGPANLAAGLDQARLGGLFPSAARAIRLEVGFGGGEHLAAQAAAHPDIGFIGCEPFINGVARLLAAIEAQGLTNIRVVPDDARPLLAALADATLDRVYVLFPDPWPKRRHHKRRFVNPDTVAALARVMADNAMLHLATDHGEYARWMLWHLRAHPDFEWTARQAADWRTAPDGAIPTRYQQKAEAAGRPSTFLNFRREPRTAV